jgi:hypothetical protein
MGWMVTEMARWSNAAATRDVHKRGALAVRTPCRNPLPSPVMAPVIFA